MKKKRSWTVLLVDDDDDLQRIYSSYLETEGHQPVGARTLAEAEQILVSQRFDAILLDLTLPDCRGHEVVERIVDRTRGVETPIVLMTAESDWNTVFRGVSAGACKVVNKPFTGPQLTQGLEQVMTRGKR